MKAVILAGGYGSRITEETVLKPKPMIEIGGKPILWHIMKIYSQFGIQDFIICLGYKGHLIKEYFANYYLHSSDVTFDMNSNRVETHQNTAEPWKVTLVDTGEHTMTGGRLKRIINYTNPNEPFCMTYGDGVANIDMRALVQFHEKQKALATLTAVQPPGRFGSLNIVEGKINSYVEKPPGDGSWINGGFFVLSPKALDLIADDSTVWEKAPLETLASKGQLAAYKHSGFWYAMDTLRDKNYLEDLWKTKDAPWKVWS